MPKPQEKQLIEQLSFKINSDSNIWFRNINSNLGLCSPDSDNISIQATFKLSETNKWILVDEFLYTRTSGSIY